MEPETNLRDDRPTSLNLEQETVRPNKPLVAPRVLTGPASSYNQGAIDWGRNGLLAYGCQYTVVIVDTKNVQPIQSLDKHKSMVNRVLWGAGRHKKLVSSDSNGHIVVWNIPSGKSKFVLQDSKSPATCMAWLTGYDEGNHLLLTLHPPYALVLWDTLSGTKLWKKTYTESLVAFDLNPFEANKIAFQCTDCILFVSDLSPSKMPSSNGRKFYISSPKQNSNSRSTSSGSLMFGNASEEKHGTRDRLRRLMRDLVVGEVKPKADESVPVAECLQVIHHQAIRNLLLLVYPSEILILDLHINHTVGLIPLERSTSPLLQVVSARQRNVLYCLHESGSVSVRFHRQQPQFLASPLDAHGSSSSLADNVAMGGDSYLEMAYEQKCQSEVIRQTKGSKIIGIAVSRMCEKRIALFINTGKIVFLELQSSNVGAAWYANLISHSTGFHINWPKETLSDLVPPLNSDAVVGPVRLLLMGLLHSITSPLTAVKMCPLSPCKIKQISLNLQGPLLAAGTSNGLVQIINVATGTVEKEVAVSSYPIRGIEWVNHNSILTWSYPNSSPSSNLVRNELRLTNILTGYVQQVRQDRGDEAPVEIVRVSPLRCYFAVVQKDATVEVWDMQTLHLLWTLSKKFSGITALEWMSPYYKRGAKKRDKEARRSSQSSVPSTPTPVSDEASAFGSAHLDVVQETDAESARQSEVVSEQFALADTECNFYYYIVEGNVARDSIKVLQEPGKAQISCLTHKGEQIVQGDVEGNLHIFYLKAKKYSVIATGRGAIKKIGFAPGETTMKLLVLYNDGVMLLHLNESLKRVELKCPRDMVSIVDIDWASEDCPLLVSQDGCIRIMDSSLKECSSSINEYEFHDRIYCVALLPKNVRTNLEITLVTRYWEKDTEASMVDAPKPWQSFTTEDGFTELEIKAIGDQLRQIDPAALSLLSAQEGMMGVAERSLLVARLFGEQFDVDFWTVALYYLRVAQAEQKQRLSESDFSLCDFNNLTFDSPSSTSSKTPKIRANILPLDSHYDYLCDSYTYKRQQMDRVIAYESKRGDEEHTKKVIQELILLGETDRAVQLLLETELENPNYYTDAIKACLVATIQSTGAAQSTIKLVATNLIANGNIWEGVQLLCLIGKGLDACRYLLSYNLWDSAVWLAKSVLPPAEMHEVMRKYADHLFATGHRNEAILVILSMSSFERVLETLGGFRLHKHAGLFLQACREFGLLPQRKYMEAASPQTSLLTAVELDFARCLFDSGNHRAALLLCKRLGDSGNELRREFEILAEETM
ncbi:WD repeat-containing protein 11-like [Thrips palmi]|uniref:WD repeat-containing protein 11-like n=1 Tax=Thrips palmi TaxID=161013 RepID=A0A6P8ZAZ3_THRPL|nr:WD repeat-containing protein 11-like [Thrips palmi]